MVGILEGELEVKDALAGVFLLTLLACSSSSDEEPNATPQGTGGTGGTTTCGSAQPSLLYTTSNVLRGPAVDDQFVYFVENVNEIRKLPKAGGAASTVSTLSGTTGLWDVHLRVYVDGEKLYYSDNQALYSLDKAGGTPSVLAVSASTNATGIHPMFAFDDESIYFGDRASTTAGDANGTVSKVSKTGGTPTVLATGQAGPSSVVLDDANVYWINEGTITSSLTLLNNSGIASVAKAGGAASVLFTEKTDGSGVGADSGDLLVAANSLFFSSIDLNDFSNTGEYELAKTGGTPVSFSDCPTLGAFLLNGVMYADCGDRISKFDLTTGAETELVCFPVDLEGSLGMTHDDSTIYYVKAEHSTGADQPYAIYSIPLE
jgi:hypothetical protein